MDITVLGIYGGVPTADGACVGYLLKGRYANILLDCGNGTISNLQKIIPLNEINMVIISHTHYDHIADLSALRYAIEVGMKHGTHKPVVVYCPSDALKMDLFQTPAFKLIPINEKEPLDLVGLKITFKRTLHNSETYAVRVQEDDKVIGYTADTGYAHDVTHFLYGSDLLIAESSLLQEHKRNTVYHLDTHNVCTMAKIARAKKLLLTHFWYSIDPKVYLKEAKASNEFKNIEIAKQLKTYKP